MTAVDLDALAATDPDLAARLRAHLDVEAALADREELLDDEPVDEQPAPAEPAVDAAAVKRARKAARRAERAAARDAADTESWDAFWSERSRAEAVERPHTTIRGVHVPVPHDLPLAFERRVEELKGSSREEDVRELVGMVFGGDVLGEWVSAGMGRDEFETVLLWGMAAGRGKPLTFAEAREAVLTRGNSLRPVANRAARRGSGGSGGPSKRTSHASTGSGRKRSRR